MEDNIPETSTWEIIFSSPDILKYIYMYIEKNHFFLIIYNKNQPRCRSLYALTS